MSRTETIGRAGLNRSAGLALNDHVAALAKADEICQGVGIFRSRELAKRLDVVHGNAGANMLGAPLARFVVAGDSFPSSYKPPLAAIGGYSTNVVRRIASRLLLNLEGCVTGLAAKPLARFSLVLATKPRLDLKDVSALRASVLFALNLIERVAGFEGVGRGKPLPPRVPDLMGIRHRPNSHVPFAAASLATEPRRFSPVTLNFKRHSAYFACFRNHIDDIARTTGVAKRIEQAQRQGDLFIEGAAA